MYAESKKRLAESERFQREELVEIKIGAGTPDWECPPVISEASRGGGVRPRTRRRGNLDDTGHCQVTETPSELFDRAPPPIGSRNQNWKLEVEPTMTDTLLA